MKYLLYLLLAISSSCASVGTEIPRAYDEVEELRKSREFMLHDFGQTESNNMSEFFSTQAGQSISMLLSDVVVTENGCVGVVTLDIFINNVDVKKSMYLVTIFDGGWRLFSIAAD